MVMHTLDIQLLPDRWVVEQRCSATKWRNARVWLGPLTERAWCRAIDLAERTVWNHQTYCGGEIPEWAIRS